MPPPLPCSPITRMGSRGTCLNRQNLLQSGGIPVSAEPPTGGLQGLLLQGRGLFPPLCFSAFSWVLDMRRTSTPPEDDYQIRCPRLGHQVYFAYCRREYNGKLCKRLNECWSGKIPISLLKDSSCSTCPKEGDWQVAPDKLSVILGIVARINSEHAEKQ